MILSLLIVLLGFYFGLYSEFRDDISMVGVMSYVVLVFVLKVPYNSPWFYKSLLHQLLFGGVLGTLVYYARSYYKK